MGKYRWIFLKAATTSDFCHGAVLLTIRVMTCGHRYEYRAYFKKVLLIPGTYITRTNFLGWSELERWHPEPVNTIADVYPLIYVEVLCWSSPILWASLHTNWDKWGCSLGHEAFSFILLLRKKEHFCSRYCNSSSWTVSKSSKYETVPKAYLLISCCAAVGKMQRMSLPPF